MIISCPWSLRIPNPTHLDAFLASQAGCECSYPDVGATAHARAPRGYDHDRHRVLLGRGDEIFSRACTALRQWRQFPEAWTRIYPDDAPIEVGTTVAVLIRAFGMWRLNSARIVYVVDEAEPVRRFGYAYGTLPAHVERGEERFVLQRDSNENVWYEIRAFSRAGSLLPRLGYPLVRRLQRRFVLDSQTAMHGRCNPG